LIGAPVTARIDSAAPRVEIVFCEFDSRNLAQRAALVERLQERYGNLPVVGLGADDNPDCVLAAMRAGARDFFVLGRDDATLGVQIGRLLRRSSAVAAGAAVSRPGKLFAVLSGHPHEAIAFLAEHLALALNQSAGKDERTLLLDLGTPAGAAAIFLNLNQTYSALDAINDAQRCDLTLVETAFTRHASGLYVLSLPEDLLGRPMIDIEQTLRLLQVLRGLFAYTVVAFDGHLPLSGIAGVMNLADRTLLLSDQSILKSRHNKYLLRALRLENCALDRTGLVVDNYRRRLGLEPSNLSELFDLPLLATLQTESYNRVVSMNSGEPLFTLARKDPYCAGVSRLASVLSSGAAIPKEPARRLFDRFLG
jgi:pilus assembly protein CpaE